MLLASFGTAYAGGIPRKIKKGVIKKPPPTPNKPDRTPTNKLNKKMVNQHLVNDRCNEPGICKEFKKYVSHLKFVLNIQECTGRLVGERIVGKWGFTVENSS